MCYFYISNHGRVKNRLFQSFSEKNRANLAKKFKLLRIRSKLRKSGAYWGHWEWVKAILTISSPSLPPDRSLPCSSLAPSCPYSDKELLSDLSDLLGLSAPPSSRPRRQAIPYQRRPALRRQEQESWAPEAAALRRQEPERRRVGAERRRVGAEQRRRRWRQPVRRQGQGMPPIFTYVGSWL